MPTYRVTDESGCVYTYDADSPESAAKAWLDECGPDWSDESETWILNVLDVTPLVRVAVRFGAGRKIERLP